MSARLVPLATTADLFFPGSDPFSGMVTFHGQDLNANAPGVVVVLDPAAAFNLSNGRTSTW